MDLETLKAENEALKKELETAEAVIEELKAELEKAKAEERNSTQFPQVKIGKDVYDIVIPFFNYEGQDKSSKDVQEDKELAAALLKMGSGVLKKHQ